MNHPAMEELAHMLGHHMGRKRKAKDRFAVPPQHIRALYEKIDALRAAKEEDKGYIQASLDLWSFVKTIIPASANKDASINTNDVLHPTIDILSDKSPNPTVGVDGVVAVYEIPEEHLYRFIELCEGEERSALAKFDLWTFTHNILPLKNETDDGQRLVNSIKMMPEWVGVVSKVAEDE